jgi:hypothetical protein
MTIIISGARVMNLTKTALLLGIFFAGPVLAQDSTEVPERYAELEQEKSGFKETWVAPGADFTKYSKLYIWKAEFQFRDVGPARRSRSTMLSTRKSEFGISEKDREEFQRIVREAFLDEIQKAKNFELVEDLDRNTLVMRGAVLDIISRVPPETVGRSEIYLQSIGEATLVMELIDAGTGEVVALVAERRHLQRSGSSGIGSMPTNTVTIVADLRGWARRAARVLRTELDDAIAGK